MQPDARQRLADVLIAARREGRQIAALPPDLVPETPAEGYAVNALVANGLGWEPLGWKIAGTNPEMQRRLRLNEPIYGRSYKRFETRSPARFNHDELLDPIIECEFFFRLGRDLPPRTAVYGRDEVTDAVMGVFAGVEVAECRFPVDRLPAVPAILADGAANGRYVIGDEIVGWRARDLASMPVALSVNGAVRRTGSGREIMEDPINALIWLANTRSAWGDGLAAGALISTGTATGMLLATRGDVMRATFAAQATVELAFA